MAYNVYDNFLDKDDFFKLQNTIMGFSFPWFFSDSTSKRYEQNAAFFKNNNKPAIDSDYQFNHIFYQDSNVLSSFFEIIDPLIKKINPSSIIRIKANLTNKTESSIVYGMHIDSPNTSKNFKSAVYYLNTTNGPTIFEDGTEIDCVENRLLVFDTGTSHSAVSQTDKKTRVIINLNFYDN